MDNSPISVALAIIYQGDRFLMQLRDEKPNIYYPGHWGLFGGHLEPNETPEAGLKREVWEEIAYRVNTLQKFGCYNDDRTSRHIYSVPLNVSIEELELNEGYDLKLLSSEDIIRGSSYSTQADRIKPLGDIHQKILLDFLAVYQTSKLAIS